MDWALGCPNSWAHSCICHCPAWGSSTGRISTAGPRICEVRWTSYLSEHAPCTSGLRIVTVLSFIDLSCKSHVSHGLIWAKHGTDSVIILYDETQHTCSGTPPRFSEAICQCCNKCFPQRVPSDNEPACLRPPLVWSATCTAPPELLQLPEGARELLQALVGIRPHLSNCCF